MPKSPYDHLELGTRNEKLPDKFTAAERAAWDWLWDCNIRPWFVDLATKEVSTPSGKFKSLVDYAKHKGMR